MTGATITKLDAARRQLETAALLYFNDRDQLSIHTLAAAAGEVLGNLAKRAGKSSLLQESFFNYLSPDMAKEARDAMRGPQNFLKHADRDPEATLEFSPRFTELIMFDAMATFARVSGEQPLLLEAFAMWFVLHHSDLFQALSPELQQTLASGQKFFARQGRRAFLDRYLTQKTRLSS